MNIGQKVVIYLDQNFISDIAKLSLSDKKDKVKPELQKVFGIIKAGANEEKFLSPTSWIHELETAAENNPDLRDAIRSYQGYVGQVEFRPYWEIKDAQFRNALFEDCGVTAETLEPWQKAFRENPDKRMENFKIDVNMPDLGLGKLLPGPAQALQEIRDKGVKEKDQYLLEIDASRKHYKALFHSDYAWALKKYFISIDRAERFIDSDKFAQIPNINIFARLWSKILADKNRKRGIEGDYNDVEFLSLYLPYSGVMATDHYMKTQIETLELDAQYQCRVFSMKNDGLQDLADYLEQLKKITLPANQSLFSVLALMNEEKQAFPIEFLKSLKQAQSKFQNTGKNWDQHVYTEVFLLYQNKNKIIMPQSRHVRTVGPRAFTRDQWSEMLVFGLGFKKIYNKKGKTVEEITKDLADHLRGSGTAVITESDVFDHDVEEHDSYLFYDIEEAILNRQEHTKRYNIRILYSIPSSSIPGSA